MKIALMSGPLAVSFEVYDDFFNYKVRGPQDFSTM